MSEKWITVAERRIRLIDEAAFDTDYSIGYTSGGLAAVVNYEGNGYAIAGVGTRILNRGGGYVWEVIGDSVGSEYAEWQSSHVGNTRPADLTDSDELAWEYDEEG